MKAISKKALFTFPCYRLNRHEPEQYLRYKTRARSSGQAWVHADLYITLSHRGMKVQLHTFLTSALGGVSGQLHVPAI